MWIMKLEDLQEKGKQSKNWFLKIYANPLMNQIVLK